MAHAATPWQWWTSNSHMRLTSASGKDGDVISAGIAADGMLVVNVNQENAEFIVRACNSHPQLVEALMRLRNECDLEGLRDRAGFDCWLNLADKALAAAELPAILKEQVAI